MPESKKREVAKRVKEQPTRGREGTSTKSPRTAGGKKGSPEVLAQASLSAQEGLRERTEAGHLAAGRTPPSQETQGRQSGATRIIDDSIRTFTTPVTED